MPRLSFLAASTSRIRLGTLVTANTFRAPALLVKTVSTLDVLSRGRAWLGIGAGYHQAEADMMGLHLPAVRERFERLEDTLELARRMWEGDDTAFVGRHHRLTRPINSPRPISTPRVLIGGTGEQRTLKLVARYADACNLFDIPDGGATIRRKLDVLAAHCETAGRPFEQIEKTVSTRLGPTETPEEFVRRCAVLAGYGIDHVIALTAGPWTYDAVSRLVEANRAVAR